MGPQVMMILCSYMGQPCDCPPPRDPLEDESILLMDVWINTIITLNEFTSFVHLLCPPFSRFLLCLSTSALLFVSLFSFLCPSLIPSLLLLLTPTPSFHPPFRPSISHPVLLSSPLLNGDKFYGRQ